MLGVSEFHPVYLCSFYPARLRQRVSLLDHQAVFATGLLVVCSCNHHSHVISAETLELLLVFWNYPLSYQCCAYLSWVCTLNCWHIHIAYYGATPAAPSSSTVGVMVRKECAFMNTGCVAGVLDSFPITITRREGPKQELCQDSRCLPDLDGFLHRASWCLLVLCLKQRYIHYDPSWDGLQGCNPPLVDSGSRQFSLSKWKKSSIPLERGHNWR